MFKRSLSLSFPSYIILKHSYERTKCQKNYKKIICIQKQIYEILNKTQNLRITQYKKIHKLKHFLKETKKTTIMYNKQSKLI